MRVLVRRICRSVLQLSLVLLVTGGFAFKKLPYHTLHVRNILFEMHIFALLL